MKLPLLDSVCNCEMTDYDILYHLLIRIVLGSCFYWMKTGIWCPAKFGINS
jgi:hypothetical protein